MLLSWLATVGCESDPRRQAVPAVPAATPSELRQSLWEAELHRDLAAITNQALSSRDVETRRAAARALSRAGGGAARDRLKGLIADVDPMVVSWAALGLSRACPKLEHETVGSLVTAAARLFYLDRGPAHLPAVRALTDGLARCGTTQAERSLATWLEAPSPIADAAALGLGQLAARRGRLDEETLKALLRLAERKDPPKSVLYPFAELTRLSEGLRPRLLQAIDRALSASAIRRAYALRALPAAGTEALGRLETFALSAGGTPVERALAVRGLGKLGEPGQAALVRVVSKLVERGALKRLEQEYLLVLAALQALSVDAISAHPVLETLASEPLHSSEAGPTRRRRIELRCTAAALLAGKAASNRLLLACDPDKGRAFSMARMRVLQRGRLVGDRRKLYLQALADSDPAVAQAALRMAPAHSELGDLGPLLQSALSSSHAGTITTALQVLRTYPDRVHKSRTGLRRAVNGVLKRGNRAPLEQRVAAIGAAASLQLLQAKPLLEVACSHPNPTLREHAERALRLLGDRDRDCPDWMRVNELAEPPVMPSTTRLKFVTDVGELKMTLDPKLAPLAVARVLRLVNEGYYDDLAVHRVVPGFVVQFGDRDGDGFEAAEPRPIGTEYSPAEFGSWSVGMALAGPDSGATQLFVTLSAYPRLRGDYAWLGRAEPGWEKLAEGDRIRRIVVDKARPKAASRR